MYGNGRGRYTVLSKRGWGTKAQGHATNTSTTIITENTIPTLISSESRYCGLYGGGDSCSVFGSKFFSKLLS